MYELSTAIGSFDSITLLFNKLTFSMMPITAFLKPKTYNPNVMLEILSHENTNTILSIMLSRTYCCMIIIESNAQPNQSNKNMLRK